MKYVEVGQKNSIGQKIVSILFLFLFGGSMLMIAFNMQRANKEFFKTAVPTQGTITQIKTSSSSSHGSHGSRTKHTVYVSYEVDGKAYESALGYYTSGMSVGDSIEVWYQPDNPQRILSKEGSGLGVWVLGAMGVLFLVLAVVALFQTLTGRGGNDGEN